MFTVCVFIIHFSVSGMLVMTKCSDWINVSIPQERCWKWTELTGLIERSNIFHLNTYYSKNDLLGFILWSSGYFHWEELKALTAYYNYNHNYNYKIKQTIIAHTLYSKSECCQSQHTRGTEAEGSKRWKNTTELQKKICTFKMTRLSTCKNPLWFMLYSLNSTW